MQPNSVADSIARAAAAAAAMPPKAPAIDSVEMYRGSLLASTTQMAQARESLDSLAVEIQKKFALSFACFVFVLFGPPIALRFPRGGVGVTLGVSIVVFGLYYICLMAGEALADKGKLPAIVAMWAANIIFTVVGVILLWRIESTVDSSRGGGIREWFADRSVKRQLARERATRQSSTRVNATPEATA
jgi:lipopolysaccharide export system permease protein